MASLIYNSEPVNTIRDIYGELNDRLKVLEDKSHTVIKLCSWKNPAHKAYKSKRRSRR